MLEKCSCAIKMKCQRWLWLTEGALSAYKPQILTAVRIKNTDTNYCQGRASSFKGL